MADQAQPAAGAGAQRADAAPPASFFQKMISTGLQMYLMYTLMSYFRGGSTPSTSAPSGSSSSNAPLSSSSPNLFRYGTVMDFQLRTSETPYFNAWESPSSLAWHIQGIVYGDWESSHAHSTSIPVTESLAHNATLYAHMYLYEHGVSADPSSAAYRPNRIAYSRAQINKYMPPLKHKNHKNLITGEGFDEDSINRERLAKENTAYVSYWTNNLTIALVTDQTVFKANSIPDALQEYYQFEPNTGAYYPIVWVNRFWALDEFYYPLNDTLTEVPLNIVLEPLSFMRFAMYTQLGKSLDSQGAMTGSSSDDFKRILIDNNPAFLLLTFAVSILHSVFDFLAFKNDISFWKDRQNMEGLSLRTIFVDLFSQIVIFLYLLDNETSWMIIISSGIGIVIEAWKIRSAFRVTRIPRFPFLQLHDHVTYSGSKTKEFDEQAFRYLTVAAVPLLGGYAVYSLVYNSHKGWYSFVVSTLVGFVYTFGFIKMTPQLFINYKLKTVAHMPWRAFTYKALNTVVDDLFAFVIRMPIMHRIACFRDDLIFLIYLYQRYIYPVDKKRVNEFGQSGEDAVEVKEDAKENNTLQEEKHDRVEEEQEEAEEEEEQDQKDEEAKKKD